MSSFWDSEELLGKLPKNSREEIHIKQVVKNGKEYLDIRTFWYDPADDTYKPSQKCVTIPFEVIAELKSIIQNIKE
ncbi:transcriptional coactivator p15 [Thermoclostridium stercorarium subsp. thermolacticum DSM 2910]|uniref:Transcriptional coactivator p15 n=1 Tax=Thermoclostridium stercorarium subsp. thermolacticum DSM 2910 TaxID=1121336 RepID=A0A1B1YFG1_THEST|nr:transcriptional coactivator p15/PC4 family protein [Thermoclostridium stercorarium]ANW99499.1 transcriptional coactivator p15 [Thermoclostridium stercorarium subsp. thermolacticum DSM 2910]